MISASIVGYGSNGFNIDDEVGISKNVISLIYIGDDNYLFYALLTIISAYVNEDEVEILDHDESSGLGIIRYKQPSSGKQHQPDDLPGAGIVNIIESSIYAGIFAEDYANATIYDLPKFMLTYYIRYRRFYYTTLRLYNGLILRSPDDPSLVGDTIIKFQDYDLVDGNISTLYLKEYDPDIEFDILVSLENLPVPDTFTITTKNKGTVTLKGTPILHPYYPLDRIKIGDLWCVQLNLSSFTVFPLKCLYDIYGTNIILHIYIVTSPEYIYLQDLFIIEINGKPIKSLKKNQKISEVLVSDFFGYSKYKYFPITS